MKNLIIRFIKSVKRFLKKRIDLPFLNAAGVLVLAGLLLISVQILYIINVKAQNEAELFSESPVYSNITYIKPFTSLVGFNLKFHKENKRRTKESKAVSFSFPLTVINPF